MSIFSVIRNMVDNVEVAVNGAKEALSANSATQQPSYNVNAVESKGLTLEKGQRLTLEKNGKSLDSICVGVNWGMIQKTFGNESVDLDVSCATFANNKLDETISFRKLKGTGIIHSGDDLTGDSGGNDGLDNEVISINLPTVKSNVDQIYIILNSYRGHKFNNIPYASIRIYEGTPSKVDNIIATYDVGNDNSFKNSVSMIMGKLYKKDNQWKFNAIGDAVKDDNIEKIIKNIINNYL